GGEKCGLNHGGNRERGYLSVILLQYFSSVRCKFIAGWRGKRFQNLPNLAFLGYTVTQLSLLRASYGGKHRRFH
ncbi:hypothetical protein, partial [Anaerolinea sp.]|uniref:hypothetical protein n=1 Tax=Anaerolinea sp. TaxID=1872519 RepID=UPI002ACD295F